MGLASIYSGDRGIQNVDAGNVSPLPGTPSADYGMMNAAANSGGVNPFAAGLVGAGAAMVEQGDEIRKEKAKRAHAMWDAELEHTLQMKRVAAADAMKRIEQKARLGGKLEENEALRNQELGWADSEAEASGAFGPYAGAVAQSASQYGIPPAILSGVIAQESGFRPDAVGDGGNSVGMGQFYTKGALAEFGLTKEEVLAMTPEQQIDLTAKFLAKKIEEADGDVWEGVGRYNGGKNNVKYQNLVRKQMRDWTGGKASGAKATGGKKSGGLMNEEPTGGPDPMSSPKAAQTWWGTLKTDQRASIDAAMQDVNWETLDPTGKMTVNQRRALVDEFGTEALIAQHLGVDLAAATEADARKEAKEPGLIKQGLDWAKRKFSGDSGDNNSISANQLNMADKSNPDHVEYAKLVKSQNPGMSDAEVWKIVDQQVAEGY
jgi:soluble lytic murein transglycosylase-like protein